LTTPEELSRLLNLALKGLKDLIAEGGFHQKTIAEIKQQYEENTSDVNAFLIQEYVVDTSNPEYRILTDDLYASCVNLCKSRCVLPFEKSVFGKELAKHGIHSSQLWDSVVRDTYYLGVILRSSLRKPGQVSL
jgi:putative DNA primase/helicase